MATDWIGQVVERTGGNKLQNETVDGFLLGATSFTCRFTSDEAEVVVDVTVELHNGRTDCTSVTVSRREGRAHSLVSDDLDVPLGWFIETAVRGQAFAERNRGEGAPMYLLSPADRERMPVRRTRRTRVTPELLGRVADVYLANVDTGAPTMAVQDHFHTSLRTASRWVSEAKKRFPERFIEGSNDE